MKTSLRHALLLCAPLLGLAHSPALAEGCDALQAARIKMIRTPNKMVITTPMKNGPDLVATQISITDTTYWRLNGGPWKVESRDAAKLEQEAVKRARDGKDDICTVSGQEMVGDEMADIYVETRSGFFRGGQTRTWISPTLGLPLKAELPFDAAATMMLYDYKNVQAPTDQPPAAGK